MVSWLTNEQRMQQQVLDIVSSDVNLPGAKHIGVEHFDAGPPVQQLREILGAMLCLSFLPWLQPAS